MFEAVRDGVTLRVLPLAVLGVIALLIGALGGLVGKWASDTSSTLLDPGASLATTSPPKERPPGSVAAIAARVVPPVRSIEIQLGDPGRTRPGGCRRV